MKLFNILSLTTLLVLSVSCATKQDKAISKELAQKPEASSHQEVDQKVRKTIEASTQLTEIQKTQLLDLQDKTQTKMLHLKQEEIKLHEILVKEFGTSGNSPRFVNSFKKKLRQNARARIDAIMGSMKEANKILGREKTQEQNEIMSNFFYGHMNR